MYQSLSQTAKEILALAEKLAKSDQCDYVGTEHVLLAILEHGLGVGAQVLDNCGISLAAVRDQVAHLNKHSLEETWVLGRLPGTPHFKQVLSYAIQEAERVNDAKIGTEYLLLGLLREKGCIAEKSLRNLGLTLSGARKEIARLQGRNHRSSHP